MEHLLLNTLTNNLQIQIQIKIKIVQFSSTLSNVTINAKLYIDLSGFLQSLTLLPS